MKTLAITAFAAGAMMVPAVAFAAGFQNTAHSATSTAMGGIGAANADEPNSSYYNPAMMTQRDKLNVYIGDTLIMPKVKYDGPADTSSETVSSILPPPNFHIAFPFTDSFAAGLGVTLPYGLTIEYPRDWAGREIIQRQQLTTVDINPNVAYKIPGTELSISAGAQFVIGSIVLERTTVLRDDTEVDAMIGGGAFGIGGAAGVFFKPTDNFSIGLNYRSAFDLSADEGKAHFENEEGTPFEGTFVDQPIAAELNLPHALVAGVGFRMDKVFLGLDVGWTGWSRYKRIDVNFSRPCEEGDAGCTPGEETNPPTTSIIANWNDSFAFRLGGEYKITDNWPVRVGGAFDMSPIPEETVAPSLPGNNRAVLTLGTGYTWNAIRADVAYMLVRTRREITNGNQDGTYTTTANLVGINLGYGF